MRRRVLMGVGALACAAVTSFAAGAGATLGLPIGTEGPHSANVHPLMNVPTTTGVGGIFSGGYYYQTISDPVADYAYVTPPVVGGVGVFDVSNPEKPSLTGFLPLPHWQNEDVSVSEERKLLLVSNESLKIAEPGTLNVVDISNPSLPRLVSNTLYPGIAPPLGNGIGHTVSFVGKGRYAYIAGQSTGGVLAVDLKDPAKPKFLSNIPTPAGNQRDGANGGGGVHDVYTDQYQNLWMMGEGGTAMYAPFNENDPLHPKLLAAVSKADNKKFNFLIHHNAIRMSKDKVLITEEAYGSGNCGPAQSGEGPDQDGSLQVWQIDLKHHKLLPLGRWDVPSGDGNTQGFNATSLFLCSSHWFTLNSNNIVADAWYAAGVRFLDVGDPANIRQVGYYVGDSSVASQARFVPGRPDLVYVSDYVRGIDVVKLDNAGKGAKTVKSPTLTFNERQKVKADPIWGFMCAMPSLNPVASSLALHGTRSVQWSPESITKP